jgi:hypothetical protein
VKYDLNQPSIKWSIGFGDDPVLAARGITGTGVAATLNGIIVTEAGHCASVRDVTTRYAPGTATMGNSSGLRGSAETLSVRP